MSDKSLSNQSAWYFSGRLFSFVISFFIPLLLVRMFTKEEYGIYGQILLIYQFVFRILQFGFRQSILYFIPKYPNNKHIIITNTTILFLTLGLINLCLFYIFDIQISDLFNSPSTVDLIPLIGLYILTMLLTSTFESIFISESEAKKASLIVVFTSLARSLLLIASVFILRSIQGLLIGLILHALVRLVLFYIYNHRSLSLRLGKRNMAFFKEQFRYSSPMGLAAIVGTSMKSIDKILISMFFTPQVYAIYNIGTFRVPFIEMIFNSVAEVSLPRAVKMLKAKDLTSFFLLWKNIILGVSFFGIWIFFMFQVIAHDFVTFLFTDEYAESVAPFRIILGIMLIQMSFYGIILRAIANTREVLISNVIALLVSIPFTYFGIKYMGVVGAAGSALLVFFVNALVQIIFTLQALKKNAFEVYPIRKLLQLSFLAIIIATGVYFLQGFIEFKILRLLFSGTVFSVLYLFISYKLKIINIFEISIIRKIIEQLHSKTNSLWKKLKQK
jgi:O-antigen/teichoic acid export membrane protein